MKGIKRLPANPQSPIGVPHVVFIDGDRNVGMSSNDAGHSHQLQFLPARPPAPAQTDPTTGQVIAPADPGSPGGWQMTPGPDGHTHDGFEEIVPNVKQIEGDDSNDQKVSDVIELWKTWYQNEQASIEAGKECEAFYDGTGQWTEDEKSQLAEQSRACLTLNQIERPVDTLSGYERQQRTELRFVPQEGGDQKAADLYNILTKQILDAAKFWEDKSEAFTDMAITGRAGINLRVSFDDCLDGDIIPERYEWDQFVYGPHSKKDASDAEGMVKFKWYSRAKAKQLWADFADEIDRMLNTPPAAEMGTEISETQPGSQANGTALKNTASDFPSDTVDISRKSILLLECHRNVYVSVPVIWNQRADFYLNALGWTPGDLKAIRTIPGFSVVDRTVRKIRITKVLGNLLVSDQYPADLPTDKIHFIPIYAKRRRGRFWGIVEGCKDPQREVNKRASQSIDIGNRMAAYNWFFDQNTFPDNELERFKNQSSTPGATFEVNDTNKIPVKTEGTKFPGELVQLMQLAQEQIDKRLSVTVDNAGANTSGAAILQAQKLKLLGHEYLFDAMTSAMFDLGRLMIPLIKRYYPAERILRTVRNSSLKNPQMIGGQPMEDFTDDDIRQILDENDLEKFDLIVSEANFSPSARLSIFMILTDLAGKGIQIPPEMLLQFADVPEGVKKDVMDQLEQQAASASESSQNAQDAEIEKTLVAKNIISPRTAQRFQIPSNVSPPPQDQAPAEQQAPPPGGVAEGA
jgi:hypothetical protein